MGLTGLFFPHINNRHPLMLQEGQHTAYKKMNYHF